MRRITFFNLFKLNGTTNNHIKYTLIRRIIVKVKSLFNKKDDIKVYMNGRDYKMLIKVIKK